RNDGRERPQAYPSTTNRNRVAGCAIHSYSSCHHLQTEKRHESRSEHSIWSRTKKRSFSFARRSPARFVTQRNRPRAGRPRPSPSVVLGLRPVLSLVFAQCCPWSSPSAACASAKNRPAAHGVLRRRGGCARGGPQEDPVYEIPSSTAQVAK